MVVDKTVCDSKTQNKFNIEQNSQQQTTELIINLLKKFERKFLKIRKAKQDNIMKKPSVIFQLNSL